MKQLVFIFCLVLVFYLCNDKGANKCDVDSINQIAFKNLKGFIEEANSNKLDISIDSFKKALSCDSTNVYSLQYIVLSHLYKKDYTKALFYNKKGLDNTSALSFFLIQRADIFELIRNQDSSAYYLEKALNVNYEIEKENRDSIEIKVQIVNLLNKLGKKKLAIQKIKLYNKEYPDNELLSPLYFSIDTLDRE